MTTGNPSNPFTRDSEHIKKDVPMPISKAKVVASKGHPNQYGFHTVRIRVYGDNSTYVSPVLAPVVGSVWIPKEGQDVAVIFGNSDKPWVIGAWYPIDRVEDGEVDLPPYTPGDIRLGNDSGSHVTVNDDGSIHIQTNENEPINIDHQSAVAEMGSDQTIPGDDTYYRLNFDTVVDDPEGLFDATTESFTVKDGGQHEVHATVETPNAGQNNRFTIALFRNGSLFKRKNQQSVNNVQLSLTVNTRRGLDSGDIIDVRMRQDSGSDKTINSNFVATELNIQRMGI